MAKKAHHSINLAFLIIFSFLAMQVMAQRPGIECGCTKSGYYKTPSTKAFSVYPDDMGEVGFSSKEKKYRLIRVDAPAPNAVNLSIYYDDKMIFSENTSAAKWGFSPDEDRFVMHGLDLSGNHWCRLVNLNPDAGVEGENAIAENLVSVKISSSVIRFSPNGKYLLYAGITNTGFLFLKIFDTKDFQTVFEIIGTRIIGSLKEKKGVAAWGFSPDKKNETFMIAYNTDIDKYYLAVKNLKAQPDEYIIKAENLQGESYWAFSPCGDYFAWLHGSPSASPECKFYKTSDVMTTFMQKPGGGVRNFAAYEDGHYLIYNFLTDSLKIFDNTASLDCPDAAKPTWPTGSILDTVNVKGPSLKLRWTEAEDNFEVTNYKIFQDGDEVIQLDNSRECEIKDLTPLTEYTFKVEAGDEAGNWSNSGPERKVQTRADNTPQWINGNLSIDKVTETKLRLTWSGAKDDYGIEYFHIFKNGELLQKIGGESDSLIVRNLKADSVYIFKIEAEDGAKQITNDGPGKTQQMPPPEPPYWNTSDKLTSSEVTETTLKLTWPPATDNFNAVKTYQIFKDQERIGTTRYNTQEFYVKDLAEGESYLFEVFAYDESGNESDPPLSSELSSLPPFVVEPLITQPADQIKPDISGNIVVWEDKRNDNADIYMYDLDTGEETQVTSNSEIQFDPIISGDRIVWVDNRNKNWDIYMYNIQTKEESAICTNAEFQFLPAIEGDYIVWQDSRNGNFDIYMMDLTTMTESPVITRESDQKNPDILYPYVVYEDNRNGDWDIYMYDLYNKKESVVCKRSGDQLWPSISRGKYFSYLSISYADGNDLYVYYPFASSKSSYDFAVPVDVYPFFSIQQNPAMQDMQLVFEDNLGGDGSEWNIYAYDFKALGIGKKIPVCVEPLSDQRNPRTSKKNIVWEDDRNGNKDIYIWKRPPGSDLELIIDDSPDPVGIGDTLRYVLSLTNKGPNLNTNLITTCTLPMDVKYIHSNTNAGSVSEQGLSLTWEIPSLISDSTVLLEIITQTTVPVKLAFEAEVIGDGFETDPLNNKIVEYTLVKEIIPGYVDEGIFSAILAEPNGKVHLSYIGNNRLKYASKLLKDKWKYIDLGQCFDCRENAMTKDLNGNIHIVASDFSRNKIPESRLYHVILKKDGTFSKQIIALSDSGFANLALQCSSDNELYLVYQQTNSRAAGHGTLKYMKTSGLEWQEEHILNEESYDHIGFAMDKNDNLHLSYYNLYEGGIIYQRKTWGLDTLTNITEWIEPGWAAGQMEGISTSIDLDSLMNPHISYAGSINKDYKEHLKYAWKNEGVWSHKKIDEGSFGSWGNKMKLGIQDRANFAYHHEPSREIRSASDVDGMIVKRTILDNAWAPDIDMDLDEQDAEHITWHMEEMIHYARVPSPEYFNISPKILDFGFLALNTSRTLSLKLLNPSGNDIYIDSIIASDPGFSFDRTSFLIYRYHTDSIAITYTQLENQLKDPYIRIFYNSTSGLFLDVPVLIRPYSPTLIVHPDPVEFGLVPLYTSDTMVVTIKNEGALDLIISKAQVVLSLGSIIIPTDFSLISNECATISPGDSCEILVGFRPTKDATYGHYSYLYIYSNDPGNPVKMIKLTGNTPKPYLRIDKHVDFGYRELSQTYHDTIILSNLGQLQIIIQSITIGGTNAGQFAFENPCGTILPGESCKIPVSFSPTITGDLSATLTVKTNYSYQSSIQVNLNGTTLQRNLSLSTDSLDFGEVAIGESSTKSLTINNVLDSPIIVEYIQLTGKDKFEFEFNSECSEISPGASCEVSVHFHPYIQGPKSAVLKILSNDTETPVHSVYLNGIAKPALPMQANVTANPVTGTDPLSVTFTTVVTGGQPPYHYEWNFDDGSYSNESNPVHEFCCMGSYLVSLKIFDALFESFETTIQIVVSSDDIPSPTISANTYSGPAPLTVNFTLEIAGGNLPVTFAWDFGDGENSDIPYPVHTYISEGEYLVTLTITDIDGDTGTDQVLIRVQNEGIVLSGNIKDSSGDSPINKSRVILYKDDYQNIHATLDLYETNSYIFGALEEGSYTMKVIPDSVDYPNKLTTYFGDVVTLADAAWINLQGNLTEQDIHVVSKPEEMTGNGVIKGQFIEGESSKKMQVSLRKSGIEGIPVVDCNVYLADKNSTILKAYSTTSEQGTFRFENLNLGDYWFIADYKGKLMEGSNTILQLSGVEDSIEILAIAGMDKIMVQVIETGIDRKGIPGFVIFPVPVVDKLYVQLTGRVPVDDVVGMQVYDISGKVLTIQHRYNAADEVIEIETGKIPSGVYFLRIKSKEETYVWRFVIVKG